MKKHQPLITLSLCCAALLLAAPIGAQVDNAEDTDVGFGFAIRDGGAALASDTSAVLAPDSGTIIVHPGDVENVMTTFKAEVNEDGSWTVSHPETEERLNVQVLLARYEYADSAIPLCLIPHWPLATLKKAAVAVLPIYQVPSYRIRRCYSCGVLGNCGPAGCVNNFFVNTLLRNHLVCRWTGNWFNQCLEFQAQVCKQTRYACPNCTGPVWSVTTPNKWVCAVF